jgi:hypothetical protein
MMSKLAKKYVSDNDEVLDVGSMDVNGSYRDLFTNYTGCDISEGKNVDIICKPYSLPFWDNSFDVVISGQTLEHTEAFWDWIKELKRVCKRLLIITAPAEWEEHCYPIDCWRILPDGMRFLLKDMEILECFRNENDTWGVAQSIIRE